MQASEAYLGAARSRLFSASVLRQFARDGVSTLATELAKESGFLEDVSPSTPFGQFLEDTFAILSRTYRTEYIYKNAIANNILLGRHSLKTAFMLTEFRAADCKADCVVLNGTSHVYEIKSDYDSVERLGRQLAAYKQVFDCVHIVTSEKFLPKVSAIADDSIGLMVLRRNGAIGVEREAMSRKEMVSPVTIFDSLRRGEYEAIIRRQFGTVPDVPNTQIYRECKALFSQLAPEIAHDEMVQAVKTRGNCARLREFIEQVPRSLKAASLTCRLTKGEQARLLGMMNQPINECFVPFVNA